MRPTPTAQYAVIGLAIALVAFARPLQAQSADPRAGADPGGTAAARALIGGTTTIALDSADIAGSGARTLAELLAGRVPGLLVTWTTGATGIAPLVTVRGISGLEGNPRAQLVVDGVLQREDDLLPIDLDGQQASHAWNLPVQEVAGVEVVLGPGAGAALPLGSSRGAVLVRTRRAAGGAPRVSGFVESTALAHGIVTPAVETTVGLEGGAPQRFCTLDRRVEAGCTPTGQQRRLPFKGNSPFRTGLGARGGVSATGGSDRLRVRVSAIGDRAGAQVDGGESDRLDVAASLAARLGTRIDATLDARASRVDLRQVPWGSTGLLDLALVAWEPGDPGIPVRFASADSVLARTVPARTARLGAGSAVSVRLPAALTLTARASVDRFTRGSTRRFGASCAPGDLSSCPADANDHAAATTTLTSLALRGGRALPAGMRLTGELGAAVAIGDQRGESFTRVTTGSGTATSFTALSTDLRLRVLSGIARLDLTRTASVAASWRQDRLERRAVGPLVRAHVAAEGSWDLGRERFFPRTRAVSGLRLVASYAENGDPLTEVALARTSPLRDDGRLAGGIERATTREAGADATFFEGAVELRARGFVRTTGDTPLRRLLAFGPPGLTYTTAGGNGLRTTGAEFSLGHRAIAAGPVRWRNTLHLSTARTTVARLAIPEQLTPLGITHSLRLREGAPLGRVDTYEWSYADGDGDGILARSEVDPLSGVAGADGVAVPTRLVGWTSTAEWRTRWRAGVQVAGAGGHRIADGRAALACLRQVCPARYTEGLPINEQARSVLLARATGPMYDGDFIRVRELWVRYTVPGLRGALAGATVTLAAQNLATWTRFPGDPEVGARVFGVIQGASTLTPPVPRTFTLAVALPTR